MDEEDLRFVLFIFQTILMPMVVIIGCVGNAVSVIILTRSHMRCSTYVYSTTLAIVDIIVLLCVFFLSLQQHPALSETRFPLYWRLYGLAHWILDSSSYTSIWLTVIFTIERYIAVFHPMRGQLLCTKSRAKQVIIVCIVLCLMLTITTPFEYNLKTETRYYNKTTGLQCAGKPQTSDSSITNEIILLTKFEKNNTNARVTRGLENLNTVNFDNKPITRNDTNISKKFKLLEINGEVCEERPYHFISSSPLGENGTYKSVFFTLTIILFTFLPLILLATFNCYLIAAVRRSHRLRNNLTNSTVGLSGYSSTQQENKITVILIAVCVLVFVCHSPTSVLLFYISFVYSEETVNILVIENICNFLITLNAAVNFIFILLFASSRLNIDEQSDNLHVERNGMLPLVPID